MAFAVVVTGGRRCPCSSVLACGSECHAGNGCERAGRVDLWTGEEVCATGLKQNRTFGKERLLLEEFAGFVKESGWISGREGEVRGPISRQAERIFLF